MFLYKFCLCYVLYLQHPQWQRRRLPISPFTGPRLCDQIHTRWWRCRWERTTGQWPTIGRQQATNGSAVLTSTSSRLSSSATSPKKWSLEIMISMCKTKASTLWCWPVLAHVCAALLTYLTHISSCIAQEIWANAYETCESCSSSYSQVIYSWSIFTHFVAIHSSVAENRQKITKSSFLGSRSFNAIDVDITKNHATSACLCLSATIFTLDKQLAEK